MKPLRRILTSALAACTLLGAYTAAYYRVPVVRCTDGDIRVYQLRCFNKDFEPYFFAPAGFVEALVVGVRHKVHPRDRCGEAIVLCTSRIRLQFSAKSDPPPNDKPIPSDADIIEYSMQRDAEIYGPRFFLSDTRTMPDGSKRESRYAFLPLDDAEDSLRDRYQRPYTLEKTLRWYEAACDEPTRIHLLVLLAASRDPHAALIVGDAMMSTSVDVRVAAVEAFNRFFGANDCSLGGNLESEFAAASKWLEENSARLRRDSG